MAKGIYITNAEPMSAKSLVVHGMRRMLEQNAQKVGLFMPVIKGDLASTRNSIFGDLVTGVTHEEATELISSNHYEELLKRILEKYHLVQKTCDVVLCIGTDFRDVSTPLELDINIDIAKNLGCVLMPVVRGHDRTPAEIVEAFGSIMDGLERRHCPLLAVIVNRVAPECLGAVTEKITKMAHEVPVYVLPENGILSKPTIREIATALQAEFLMGEADCELRELVHYKVAGVELPNLLPYLTAGALIIAGGDRIDVILGTVAADASNTFPRLAGLILSTGIKPAPHLLKLIEGFNRNSLPVLSVNYDTFDTAIRVSKVRGVISPADKRKFETALGVFEASVRADELKSRLNLNRPVAVTPLMFEHDLIQQARSQRQMIVLPEGEEIRILRAAELIRLRQVCDLTLLGNPARIQAKITELGLNLDGVKIVDPTSSEYLKDFADTYYELRKHKGVTPAMAFETMTDSSYFGTMMVHKGLAGGMVSGSINTTQHTIRPALEFVKTKPGVSIVSSVFFMCLSDRVLVFGDCAVNPNPDEKQLAEIAMSSADTAAAFNIAPRVAMLSYSTGESGKGKDVDKVREAARLAKAARPDLKIEGPLQFDAAIEPEVARIKLPKSEVAGQATVFIFPDLNTGNNTYKAVQRSANAVAIGPVLQGLNKPVNDLSRGCTVADIFNTVVITAIQAQSAARGT
jgi:phosphate acetyltransferase